MASRAFSVSESGSSGLIIEVECHSSNGLPGIVIVGLATKAVDEAKERLKSAFASSVLPFPKKRITLNLAPADVPKDGAGLDLALAISILLDRQESSRITSTDSLVFFGELALNGIIRPVRGLIGKLLAAKEKGFTSAVVPIQQASQAGLVNGINVFPARSLREVVDWLVSPREYADTPAQKDMLAPRYTSVMEEIVGNTIAKRALEVAAAGGHNVLLNGPPGTGKSMLAKAMPSILPTLTKQEILEVTNLHSLVGKSFDELITTPPFQAPHHSASSVAIIGGGQKALPGEISLADHGILFLDELPEFHRDCLEALRQPLEDHTVHISRAKHSVVYPASFILIATRNPCPCGYYGTSKTCRCSGFDIERYNKKLSGPIMDRIDMHVDVEEVAYRLLRENTHKEEKSETIRNRVIRARGCQILRNPKQILNARLTHRHIMDNHLADDMALEFLEKAAEKLQISARSFVRTLRVARTIADLDNMPTIQKEHVAEALQFRIRSQVS